MTHVAPAVISDASVLIFMDQLGLMEILEDLYQNVLVPDAVKQEIDVGLRAGEPGPNIGRLSWIQVRPTPAPSQGWALGLDRGEAAVVSLALSLGPGPVTLLMDDRDGRAVANSLGIDSIGTLGILIAAKATGRIASVAPYFRRLIAAGFGISPPILEDALARAGEPGA